MEKKTAMFIKINHVELLREAAQNGFALDRKRSALPWIFSLFEVRYAPGSCADLKKLRRKSWM